jgi:hypothetical protein
MRCSFEFEKARELSHVLEMKAVYQKRLFTLSRRWITLRMWRCVRSESGTPFRLVSWHEKVIPTSISKWGIYKDRKKQQDWLILSCLIRILCCWGLIGTRSRLIIKIFASEHLKMSRFLRRITASDVQCWQSSHVCTCSDAMK